MYCLETSALSHRFSSEIVVDHIDLQVAEGSIYGFLGPNGAGKTTTLKLILGLLKKQQGSISVFEKPFEKNRLSILKNIGSLIESPSLYGHLTAFENLLVFQKIHQCPKERIHQVLHLVGLSTTGNKKASQFSLGMKQRLSIAMALLHQPSLLILDEPTNGLDPNGMIEVRELLKKLNYDFGITIIISSHLLSEIEKLVSHIGIINKGRMMFQGTIEELQSTQQKSATFIEVNDLEAALKIINVEGNQGLIKNGKIEMQTVSKEQIARINRTLVSSGIDVYEIGSKRSDLEMIFMDLINN
jgi:ABC-type multidrug transport system ATPase subunit